MFGSRVGFSGRQISLCKQKFAQADPVAMVTKNRKFQHKIGYNSPYLRDITHILAPSKGFWGSVCLKVTVTNCSDLPLLPW